jgi:DNA-binding response OmpR family regulator
LREAVSSVLEAHGYTVRADADGRNAQEALERFRPDVALLDVWLPEGPDGFDIARELRTHSDIPLFFVTAADALEDRLTGFDIGADDYLVKPFSTAELLARLQAVLRRAGRLRSSTTVVRDLVVDRAQRQALRAGQRVALTKLEFELLATLAQTPGQAWSKRDLLAAVWGFTDFQPHLVEVHVSSLRRKLEAAGPRLIHTERGEGYVLR